MQCLLSVVNMFIMFLMGSTDVLFIRNIIIMFMVEIIIFPMDIISVYIYITEVKLYSILWDVLCTSPYISRWKEINYYYL